jgi:hypothetical protein
MEGNMARYHLDGDTYVIEGFDELPAFSSFLPGLAGVKGIPLWVYYTNRGQGINSFGIHNKSNAIMEFNPANTAYENTAIKGFRTFVKCNGAYFEPFFTLDTTAKRNLYIKKNSFVIEERNERYGVVVRVKYYVLPNDSIGALVRKVEIENLGAEVKHLEVVDGLPKIIPYGIQNGAYKEMSNLLKSWTEIKNIENNAPYYTMRSSSDDSAEVSDVEGGYYYLTVHNENLVPVIYDAESIFGHDTSLVNPISFMKKNIKEVTERTQCFYNKVPAGFSAFDCSLSSSDKLTFTTMIGFASSPEQVNEKLEEISKSEYFAAKEQLADEIVDELTGDIKTKTAMNVFDQYIEQCYLDNFLRGGYPFVFNKDNNKSVVHLFSRKHGDPERDYNFFSIAGEYYSQGNGNFRDVNQNRRNDIFFQKDIGDFNVKTFYQLIGIDGYNPLEVRPSTFSVKVESASEVESLLAENITTHQDKLRKIIHQDFTPGMVANCIARFHIPVACGEDAFLEKLLSHCNQNIEAGFGEGYWSDHWNYNLDLIESYLSIYPEKERELLFADNSYRYYDTPARVVPRSEKYVLNSKNEVRQYGALVHDEEVMAQKGFRKNGTNWLKTKTGDYVQTNLMVKLITLALNKFASLDSYGMGVEMDGGKPGWNDAMNGIPGLFGSGMAETFELKRNISFILKSLTEEEVVTLPTEVNEFLDQVAAALHQAKTEGWNEFTYWDKVSTYKENYRSKVRFTLEGTSVERKTAELLEYFKAFDTKLEAGIEKAIGYGNGIVPTFFTFRATEYEPVVNEEGQPVNSHYGLPKVVVKAFEVLPLPSFLEGPAKMLGLIKDQETAKVVHQNVKNSELYDKKLGMYKTSVPIDHISMENGRIRAFTAGWLERESIFLHMEYKYLFGMAKANLWEQYYEELPNTMVAFRDPEVYGRSILENSSFIASSVNPDSGVHGRGYVARLSGSTTEALSLWLQMFLGDKIFTYEEGQLKLHFTPKLADFMFDECGDASFRFMSKCDVTYHNPSRKATYGIDAAVIKKIVIKDTNQEIAGNCVSGTLAESIRNGEVKEIVVFLE